MSQNISISLLLVAFVALTFSSEDADRLSKIVNTKNGPVQGIIKQSRNPSVEFASFYGLRYANPPARFEPAKPFTETWSTPKLAKTPGSQCTQPGFPDPSGTEDCLFVNVHVPTSALESSKPLPVMFWVHGGGFAFGDGHNYGAEYFMENENVILVTINYRLGVLGFISMGDDNTFTSNNGLRDLVQGLKWVQENIANFNGDPNKVTIFGESAGSAAVHFLLLSPLTKGLYHGAIMQSGAFSFWSAEENPGHYAKEFAKALKCKNIEDGAEIKKCLEKVPAKKLMLTQATFALRWPVNSPIPRFLPTTTEPQDNSFFAGKPSAFFTPGNKQLTNYPSNVPVLLGVTREEGSLFYVGYLLANDNSKILFDQLNSNWNIVAPKNLHYEGFFPENKWAKIAQKVKSFYLKDKPVTKDNLWPLIKLYTDSLMLLPTLDAAEQMAKNGMKAYPFIFSHYGEQSPFEQFGLPRVEGAVGHGEDLLYFFNHPWLGGKSLKEDSEDERFSKNIIKLWTEFATTGVPSTKWGDAKPLTWNAIKTENESVSKYEILDLKGDPKIIDSGDIQERLKFWRKMLKEVWEEKGKKLDGKTEL